MDPNLQQYGIWGIIIYLFVKDVIPLLVSAVSKITDLAIPARAKQAEMKIEAEAEREARRLDIREREVIALEQLGKTLITIDTRMEQMDRKVDLLSASLVTANQALAVVLDRIQWRNSGGSNFKRRRTDREPEPKSEEKKTTPDAVTHN